MSIKDRLAVDIKTALKSGDSFRTGVLRFIYAAIGNKEIEKRGRGEAAALSDEEAEQILFTEAKKRKEAALAFEKGGRGELAEKEKKELVIIEEYLPEQMSEEEVRQAVENILTKNQADNMGAAMKAVMAELKGKADGSLVSRIVKEKFE